MVRMEPRAPACQLRALPLSQVPGLTTNTVTVTKETSGHSFCVVTEVKCSENHQRLISGICTHMVHIQTCMSLQSGQLTVSVATWTDSLPVPIFSERKRIVEGDLQLV